MAFRTVAWAVALGVVIAVGSTSPALAEPDPEGSPARTLRVTAVEGDAAIALSQLRATLNRSPHGQWQIVLSYKVANRTAGVVPAHAIDLSLQGGGSLFRRSDRALDPGQAAAVKSLLLGTAVDKLAASGADGVTIKAVPVERGTGHPDCDHRYDEALNKASCEALARSRAGQEFCRTKCWISESQSSVLQCVERQVTGSDGAVCTFHMLDCGCPQQWGDESTLTESLHHGLMRDLLGNPSGITNAYPPTLEARDIAP